MTPMQKKKRIIQKYVPPPIANIVVAAQSFFIRRLTNLFSDKLFSQDKVYLKIFILQQKLNIDCKICIAVISTVELGGS